MKTKKREKKKKITIRGEKEREIEQTDIIKLVLIKNKSLI